MKTSTRGRWLELGLTAFRPLKDRLRSGQGPLMLFRWCRGDTAAGPLTVALCCSSPTEQVYRSLLFSAGSRLLAIVPLPAALLRHATPLPADIVVVEAPAASVRRFSPSQALIQPYHVSCLLDSRGTFEEICARLPSTIRKKELRWIEKNGLVLDREPARGEADFAWFYDQMYLPTMRERHGQQARPVARDEALRSCREGALLRIFQGEAWVGGVIAVEQEGHVHLKYLGVRGGDPALTRMGVHGAVILTGLRYASARGLDAVDLEGVRPFLLDGQLLYKRKWGATLCAPPVQQNQIWFKVQRLTGTTSSFLNKTPLIVLTATGDLEGQVFFDGGDPTAEQVGEAERRFAGSGLARVRLCSTRSFARPPRSEE